MISSQPRTALLSLSLLITALLSAPLAADGFYTVTPCRSVDTRSPGQTPLTGTATFTVGGTCGIPASATSVSLTATVVNSTAAISLGLYPSTMTPNGAGAGVVASAGTVRANNAIVVFGLDGSGSITAVATFSGGGQTDLILDVNGYFFPQVLEYAGGSGAANRLISPTFYSDATSGGYSNPHLIRLNDTLYSFVQGGQFFDDGSSPPGVPYCGGDRIIMYRTPYTAAGLTTPFSAVARVSNCDSTSSVNAHWVPSDIFVLGSTYYMIAEEQLVNLSTGNQISSQQKIWKATLDPHTNQLAGSWYPFLQYGSGQTGINRFAEILVQPDSTRIPPNDGFTHQFVRGFARVNVQQTVEVRIDFSPAYCGQSLSPQACALIEFKQNGSWTAAAGGTLAFMPDTLLGNFKPSSLTSQTVSALGAVSGPLELWGSYVQVPGNNCGPCPGTSGGGFQFYKVNADWSLGNSYTIYSLVRCMPAGRAVYRSLEAPVYFGGSQLFVFSGTNEDNACSVSNPQFGEYIVWTSLY